MPTATSLITKTPGVCGGDACIRGHRIPVWSLVNGRRLGASDEKLLESYPSLTAEELKSAFDYATENRVEIEQAIWLNDTVMLDRGQNGHVAAVIRQGRQLGFTDDDIRNSFEPPLSPAELEAALADPSAR